MCRYICLAVVVFLISAFSVVENVGASEVELVQTVSTLSEGCGVSGGTVVEFGQMIRSDRNESKALAGPIPVVITAGEYDISLTSYDDHSEKDVQAQDQEEWYVIFRAGEDVVAVSGTIPDLPEEQNWLTEQVNSRLSIPRDVDNVIAKHAAYPDPGIHSVIPSCMGIKREEPPKASIGDLAWFDINKNGLQDDGEQGIPNIAVHLFDGSGQPIASTQTGGDGRYRFDNLTPGTYSLKFDPPSALNITTANAGDDHKDSDIDQNGHTPPTLLDAGEADMSWDAGFYQEREFRVLTKGNIFCDANRNQTRDADEGGVGALSVNLLRNGEVVEQAQSNPQGDFQFSAQEPGEYTIQVILPEGYELTSQRVASFSDPDMDVRAYEIGVYGSCARSHEAAIGDWVWLDINQNGLQDSGEAGVAGVTVILLNQAGQELGRTTTSSSGHYLFSGLNVGDYQLQFVPPADYVISSPNQGGNHSFDSDMNPANGRTSLTTLDPSETDLSWDAGLYRAVKQLACARFNLDLGRNAHTGAGVAGRYEMIEVSTGSLLASWDADFWWADSGWIEGIELSHPDGSWVEVYFYPEGVTTGQKLEIINPAPGTQYGWLAPGMCHAIEIQFPADWAYVQQGAEVAEAVAEETAVVEEPVTVVEADSPDQETSKPESHYLIQTSYVTMRSRFKAIAL